MTQTIEPKELLMSVVPATDEAELRRQLTAAYRLSAYFGWMDMTFNHISVRLPPTDAHPHAYLVNPEGLLSEEITPDRLLKVDTAGNVLDQPDQSFIPAGFTIHAAIHQHRKDAGCIMHNHAQAGMVVSAMPDGILPLTQRAMEFYNRVAYHEFGGIALEADIGTRIVQDLADHSVMVMRNHGLLTVGRSVAEAFYQMHYLHQTCEVQIRILGCTTEPSIPSPEVCQRTAEQYVPFHDGDVEKVWNAMIRKLDRELPGWDANSTALTD